MIKSVTVTNYLGDSIKLDLTRPDASGFIIKSIEGLGPAKASINTSDISTNDGGIFNSSRLDKRNIVFDLEFFPAPKETSDVNKNVVMVDEDNGFIVEWEDE